MRIKLYAMESFEIDPHNSSGPTRWRLFPGCRERFVPRKSHISIICRVFWESTLSSLLSFSSILKYFPLSPWRNCLLTDTNFRFRSHKIWKEDESEMRRSWFGSVEAVSRPSWTQWSRCLIWIWITNKPPKNLPKMGKKSWKWEGVDLDLLRQAGRAGHSGHAVWLILDTLSHDLLTLSQYV